MPYKKIVDKSAKPARKRAKSSKPVPLPAQKEIPLPPPEPVSSAVSPSTPPVSTSTAEALLTQWHELTRKIEEECEPLIAQERALRRQLVRAYFTTPVEGTQYCELPHNWRLRLVQSYKRRFDMAQWTSIWARLPASVGDVVVNWEPKLVVAAYRELDESYRKILDDAIVCTPDSPQVTLVPPKE